MNSCTIPNSRIPDIDKIFSPISCYPSFRILLITLLSSVRSKQIYVFFFVQVKVGYHIAPSPSRPVFSSESSQMEVHQKLRGGEKNTKMADVPCRCFDRASGSVTRLSQTTRRTRCLPAPSYRNRKSHAGTVS